MKCTEGRRNCHKCSVLQATINHHYYKCKEHNKVINKNNNIYMPFYVERSIMAEVAFCSATTALRRTNPCRLKRCNKYFSQKAERYKLFECHLIKRNLWKSAVIAMMMADWLAVCSLLVKQLFIMSLIGRGFAIYVVREWKRRRRRSYETQKTYCLQCYPFIHK